MARLDGRGAVNGNGQALEHRVKKYLDSMQIPYDYNVSNGIDFIIFNKFYVDCVSTAISGTIDEKIPTKFFKYAERYPETDDIFILHPYSGISVSIGKHIKFLEKQLSKRFHVINWEQFTRLIRGEYDMLIREDYVYSKDGIGFSNPYSMKYTQWFEYK